MSPTTLPAPPLIETRHLTRLYEGGVRALDNVSLQVEAGEVLAIMGPSGSGKSTLLHLLGALDRPTSGDVFVWGQPQSRISDIDRFRACTVGFVFQSHNLIPTLTAIENVIVPMRGGPLPAGQHHHRAAWLLTRVGLGSKLDRRPAQLSGGECQRVALARAVANTPAIILADEPTGNLDSQSGAEVLRLIGELNAQLGTTVLMVTHDPVVALSTQRIITLRDGRVEHDERVEAVYRDEMRQVQQTPLGRLLFGGRLEIATPQERDTERLRT